MRTSEATTLIAEALVKAQELIQNPSKSQDVKAGPKSYSFAPLPEILDDLRAHLHLYGLAVVQETATYEGNVGVTTRLFHTSGQWIECGPLMMPTATADAQGVGSAITYARRYALCAALSVAAEADDDGAAASKRKTKTSGAGKDPKGYGEGPRVPEPAPEQSPDSARDTAAPTQSNAPTAESGLTSTVAEVASPRTGASAAVDPKSPASAEQPETPGDAPGPRAPGAGDLKGKQLLYQQFTALCLDRDLKRMVMLTRSLGKALKASEVPEKLTVADLKKAIAYVQALEAA